MGTRTKIPVALNNVCAYQALWVPKTPSATKFGCIDEGKFGHAAMKWSHRPTISEWVDDTARRPWRLLWLPLIWFFNIFKSAERLEAEKVGRARYVEAMDRRERRRLRDLKHKMVVEAKRTKTV